MKRILAPAMLVLAAACATSGPASFDSFEAAEAADFASYDQVYIAPITASQDVLDRIGARPISRFDRTRPLDQDDIDGQIEDLREAIEERVGRVATLTDAPGPGVLTMQITLTELQSNRPTMAEMREDPSLSFESISVGAAAVDIVLSEEGRTLATIEDENFFRRIDDPAVSSRRWATADIYFDRLSRKLADLLA
ncbi:DUF3313 family protein [Parvularcula dongshanensis]|uniref:DUF3313 domain-containing protein n=1 Tax=Parvularcula dongshanensis TaxID=1173995 RepID=A0A840I115_9PROT|nr:DUF3313 family protein [Parvularcula dongshanensis]MBB4658746.1 hypothetical protein [Parvularcula dongshanensis]